jgi:hypothetical protein
MRSLHQIVTDKRRLHWLELLRNFRRKELWKCPMCLRMVNATDKYQVGPGVRYAVRNISSTCVDEVLRRREVFGIINLVITNPPDGIVREARKHGKTKYNFDREYAVFEIIGKLGSNDIEVCSVCCGELLKATENILAQMKVDGIGAVYV